MSHVGACVCVRACVCVHAGPEEGLRLWGGLVKRFPHPRWMLRTQPMGGIEKDRIVSDVFNNKPTLTQRSTIYIYIYICVCVYVYIYFSPHGVWLHWFLFLKATATPTFPFCLLVQFHSPESAGGEAVRPLAAVTLPGFPAWQGSAWWGDWCVCVAWVRVSVRGGLRLRGCAWLRLTPVSVQC